MADYAPGDYPLKPDKGCWTKLTPLQAGLCLVLFVAIPFLIVMIIVYIVFSVTYAGTSTDCMEVCGLKSRRGVRQNGPFAGPFQSDNLIETTSIVPFYARRAMPMSGHVSLSYCEKSPDIDYPFTASLIEQLYMDNEEEHFLKCIVAVLSFQWILTSSICMDALKKDEWKYLNVRLGSKLWPQGGQKIGILQVMKPPGPTNSPDIHTMVAVQLQMRSNSRTCVKKTVLPVRNILATATEGLVFVWYSNWTYPLRVRSKYRKMELMKVTVKPYSECPQPWGAGHKLFCATSIHESFGYCVFHENGPIFSNDLVLMGVQVMNYCDEKTATSYYYFEDISHNVEWLKKIGAFK